MAQPLAHYDNPELPSYLPSEYRYRLWLWTFLADMYQGRSAWYIPGRGIVDLQKAQAYLPQNPREPDAAYRVRHNLSKFDNRFAPALRGYAGLFSDFKIVSPHPTIEQYANDVDLSGNSWEVFCYEADILALRDRYCGVMVDFPSQELDEEGRPIPRTALDDLINPLRPYLVLIDAKNILNWKIETINGKAIIQQVTIREFRYEEKGRFGGEWVTYYRVLEPGYYEIWRESERTESGTVIKDVNLVESGTTTLSEVPLVFYCVADMDPFAGDPPFLNLAELNLDHYQTRSDLRMVMHKCNLPTPVRVGVIGPGMPAEEAPELALGPNSFVDVPLGGDFKFAEPTGVAIGSTRLELDKLEEDMKEEILSFQFSPASRKTAKEVGIESAQTQSVLAGMGRIKESNVNKVLNLWARYFGAESGGTIVVNKTLLQAPLSSDQINAIAGLAAQGILGQELTIRLLQEGKIIPQGIDLDEIPPLPEVALDER